MAARATHGVALVADGLDVGGFSPLEHTLRCISQIVNLQLLHGTLRKETREAHVCQVKKSRSYEQGNVR